MEVFFDNDGQRHEIYFRHLRGEALRIASGPKMMPWADMWTLENGTQVFGKAGYHEYLYVIAAKDDLELQWVNVMHEDGKLWGTLFDNGSSTGMVMLILERRVDLATCVWCGIRQHRNLGCSIGIAHDGYVALLLKAKPVPAWMGLILPFDGYTWLGIGCTLAATTLILGFCMKYVIQGKEVDWTLHCLDALHPMCGRNMLLPGLQAAHLGKE